MKYKTRICNPYNVKADQIWEIYTFGQPIIRLKILEIIDFEDVRCETTDGKTIIMWVMNFKNYTKIHKAGNWKL